MRCPAALPNETQRLTALSQYGLDGDRSLPSLEPVVKLAVELFDVPAAAVNMIGSDHVFFAASAGIGECDMRRDVSFCAHAITQDEVLVVEDALLDERFHDNPLVTGPEQIRFYAGVPICSPDGQALGALCIVDAKPHATFSAQDRERLKELSKIVIDKLELRRLEMAGRSGAGRFENIAYSSPNGVVCLDRLGTVTAVNLAAETLFERGAGEIIGQDLQILLPAWRQSQLAGCLRRPVLGQPAGIAEIHEDIVARRKDGSEFPAEIAWSTWIEDGQPSFGLVLRDTTEQGRQRAELDRLRNFDHATGLANRTLLRQRLGEAIADGAPAAVLAIGLIGFEDVNDTLGDSVGDSILQQVSGRLVQCVRAIDTVARLGSDEFAIFLSGIGNPIGAGNVASAGLAAIARPFTVDGQEVRIAARCGIAMSPSHGDSSEELVGNAGLALLEAKRQTAEDAVFFVPALRMQAVARRLFDAELHKAVEHGEFELHFQPQVRICDGALVGAEALIRWNHPERGLLSPSAFLPALETGSLTSIVGNWVIDAACRQAAEWRSELFPEFRMGFNLFAAQFRTGALVECIRTAAARYHLPGEALEIEITENVALNGPSAALSDLCELRRDGVRIAFDDFGTGYASLSLLQSYPLTHLKIDKSFVQKACKSKRDRAIIEAITGLAHQLELCVIAEGVETWEQFEFCKQMGCDEVQGYLIGKPMSADQFAGTMMLNSAPLSHRVS